MTRLEDRIALNHPHTDPETVRAIVRETLDEVYFTALEQCLEYRRKGDLQRWGALRTFASGCFGLQLT